MAVAHHETWDDAPFETVVMPTGTQVEWALWKLRGNNVIRLDKKILAGSEGTLADEYTNLWACQLPQQQLAAAGGSTVLHINGALHELGDRGPVPPRCAPSGRPRERELRARGFVRERRLAAVERNARRALEIRSGLDARELGGLDEGVEERGDLGAAA